MPEASASTMMAQVAPSMPYSTRPPLGSATVTRPACVEALHPMAMRRPRKLSVAPGDPAAQFRRMLGWRCP
jgi:hypothetical protein